MNQSKVKVCVYVGAVSNSAKGNWITLPLENEVLNAKIEALNFGDGEYAIMDMENELAVELWAYSNPHNLNQDLKIYQAYEERGELDLLQTAVMYRNDDLEDAIDFLETGNYQYFEEVTDEESLGEAHVNAGGLGWIMANPDAFEHLPEVKRMSKHDSLHIKAIRSYLDFQSIGNDLICNGCQLMGKLKTAMREIPVR